MLRGWEGAGSLRRHSWANGLRNLRSTLPLGFLLSERDNFLCCLSHFYLGFPLLVAKAFCCREKLISLVLNTEFEFTVDIQAETRSQSRRGVQRCGTQYRSDLQSQLKSPGMTMTTWWLTLTQYPSRATHHSKRIKRVSSFILTALTVSNLSLHMAGMRTKEI